MRKRNWLVLLTLALVVVLALAACGGNNEENTDQAAENEAAAEVNEAAENEGAEAANETSETNGAEEVAAPNTYTTVTVKEAFQQLADNPEAILVDVRNPDEWAATGVPKVPQGVTLIPLPELQQRAPQELPKDKTIYLICRSGNRSRVASELLLQLGYSSVVNVDGGILAWTREGLEMTPYSE